MLKLIRIACVTAALVCVWNPLVNAQMLRGPQGVGGWTVTSPFSGGRATAVERKLNGQTITNNDGWRFTQGWPLDVFASLPSKAQGGVNSELNSLSQRLNLFSITQRPSFLSTFHRSREVAQANSTWTYNGPPRFFEFTLTLDGDIGTDPIRQPFDFFRTPDVTLAANETGIINGGVILGLPDGGAVIGFLDGDQNQFPVFIGSPGVQLELSGGPNEMYTASFSMLVEAGDTFNLMMNSDSDGLLRPGGTFFGPLRTRVTTEFEISNFVNSGPGIR